MILAPDTSATLTDESLNEAKEILQKRLDTVLPEKARLSISGNMLKLELASKEHVDMATRLATEIGAVTFFLSDKAMEIGSAMPASVSSFITDQDIIHAKPSTVQGNYWSIRITFSEKGAEQLRQLTKGNIGHYMIIAKDGIIISAPLISSELDSNEVEIVSIEDINMAGAVVAQLNGGRLPYKFKIIETR